MSSHDGTRSMRQSKRYSVTALYLSMSAKEKDLEIEDDLAKGKPNASTLLDFPCVSPCSDADSPCSPESIAGTQVQNFLSVEEELRS